MADVEIWEWTMRPKYNDLIGKQPWEPTVDKEGYYGIAFGLYFMCVHFGSPEWIAVAAIVVFEVIWQIKNALIPAGGPDKVKYIGGYGFCLKQLMYASIGALLAWALDAIVPPHYRGWPEDDDCEDCDDDDM